MAADNVHCLVEVDPCIAEGTHNAGHDASVVVCGHSRAPFCIGCCADMVCADQSEVLNVHKRKLLSDMTEVLSAPLVLSEVCSRGGQAAVLGCIVQAAERSGKQGDVVGAAAVRLAETCISRVPELAAAPQLLASLGRSLTSVRWEESHGLLGVCAAVLSHEAAAEALAGGFLPVLTHLAEGIDCRCEDVRAQVVFLWLRLLQHAPPEAAAELADAAGLWPRVLATVRDGAPSGPLAANAMALLNHAASHVDTAAALLPLAGPLAAAVCRVLLTKATALQAAAVQCLGVLSGLPDGARYPFAEAFAKTTVTDHLLETLSEGSAPESGLRTDACALLADLYRHPAFAVAGGYPLEVLADCAAEALSVQHEAMCTAAFRAAAAVMDRVEQQDRKRGGVRSSLQRRMSSVLTRALLLCGGHAAEGADGQLRPNAVGGEELLVAALDAGAALLACAETSVEDAAAAAEMVDAAAASVLGRQARDASSDSLALAHLLTLLDAAASARGTGSALRAAAVRAATGDCGAVCTALRECEGLVGAAGAAVMGSVASVAASALDHDPAHAAAMLRDGAVRCCVEAAGTQLPPGGAQKVWKMLYLLVGACGDGIGSGAVDAAAAGAAEELWSGDLSVLLPEKPASILAALAGAAADHRDALRQALCVDLVHACIVHPAPARSFCALDHAAESLASFAGTLWDGRSPAGLVVHLQSGGAPDLARRVCRKLCQSLAVLEADYGMRCSLAAFEASLQAASATDACTCGTIPPPEVLRWVAAQGSSHPVAVAMVRAAAALADDSCDDSPHVTALAAACTARPQVPASILSDATRDEPAEWRCGGVLLAAAVLRRALGGSRLWPAARLEALQETTAALRSAAVRLRENWCPASLRPAAALLILGAALLRARRQEGDDAGGDEPLSGRLAFISDLSVQVLMCGVPAMRRCPEAGSSVAAAAEAAAAALERAGGGDGDVDAGAPLRSCKPDRQPCCAAAVLAAIAVRGGGHSLRRCGRTFRWSLQATLHLLRAGDECVHVPLLCATRVGAACGGADAAVMLRVVRVAAERGRLTGVAEPASRSLLLHFASDAWVRGGEEVREAAGGAVAAVVREDPLAWQHSGLLARLLTDARKRAGGSAAAAQLLEFAGTLPWLQAGQCALSASPAAA
eukprot:TRINITY_DN17282_c0_g1_i1.p1 TRINITY_DN17282_c0_g1~~TRINITY_DN17282_c0_g1_i1.p1  ORF type:complete len:1167 (+),score=379.82 TRINITY_DN17282_c0_g1_i1:49-3501(+)